jgi:hypothetical protein
MSHSGSQRIAGTDGSDFVHRERVAAHYHVSAETKSRLRILIYLHLLLALLVLCQIVIYHVPYLTSLNVPHPHLWQYIWLLTIVPSLCGLLSMNRNHVPLMKVFFRGTVLFGLGTIVTTIILNLSELFTFNKLKHNHQLDDVEPQTFLGFPLLVLWYIFLIITVQVHAFSLYMANILLGSWQQYRGTKQN